MLGFYDYTTWLTYLGLTSGIVGIGCAMGGHVTAAIICLCLAGFFDLFDGKVASTKKNRTDDMKRFGIQIDSLSDLVCFGVLPATILLALAKQTLPETPVEWFYPLAAIYVLAGLIRLAYFNVAEENRQKTEKGVRKAYNGIPITTTAVVLPFFFAVYGLLASALPKTDLSVGYLVFYCIELLFFAFGFLFQGFKIPKMHGKKLFIPLGIGAVAAVAVILAFLLNK
ncbi:MAG: CDP-alcohol phosphatidyltransferase family protein [Clostridia bacterium]|nr:CDP-alcohol phosphatidyltransferase family protein [Clostridia bacterium]